MKTTINYKDYYRQLPEILVLKYPNLNFETHCYLRIALDNAIGTRWDSRIAKPAYRNLSSKQRALVIEYLYQYTRDKAMLQAHNLISLAYRGKLR